MPISEHRSAFFVACILMHDEFPTAHHVAHGFIKTPCRSTGSSNATPRTNATPNVILHINDSSFRATSCTLQWIPHINNSQFRYQGIVACILMHDEFLTVLYVAHGFIKTPCRSTGSSNATSRTNAAPNVLLHINDSSFRATSCTLRGR